MLMLTDDPRECIAQASRIGNDLDRALTGEHGIYLSEYLALTALLDAEKRQLRVSDLARAVGLTASSTSRILTRLEARGLVIRRIGTHDRRVTFARLTDAGALKAGNAAATFTRKVTDLYSDKPSK